MASHSVLRYIKHLDCARCKIHARHNLIHLTQWFGRLSIPRKSVETTPALSRTIFLKTLNQNFHGLLFWFFRILRGQALFVPFFQKENVTTQIESSCGVSSHAPAGDVSPAPQFCRPQSARRVQVQRTIVLRGGSGATPLQQKPREILKSHDNLVVDPSRANCLCSQGMFRYNRLVIIAIQYEAG